MIMKLDEYRSFTDKKSCFASYKRYNTKQEFDSWYKEIKQASCNNKKTPKANGKFVFRGLNEAKYRLYTSGQREWLTKDYKTAKIPYRTFLSIILRNVKKNLFLKRYINALCLNPSDLLYMSFLQHYRTPTPLLDFTYSLNTALFFATDELNFVPTSRRSSINDYFSMYYIEVANVFSSCLSITSSFGVTSGKVWKDNTFKRAKINPQKRKDSLFDNMVVYIANDQSVVSNKKTLLANYFYSNPNIVAQDGCFFLYQDEAMPFEEYLMTKNYPAIKIHCVDIHKSLADYVREKTGLSRKDVYPELKDLALESYETFKKELK
ncbi:MAG: FRG domain-containing protein [Bacteroidales bacterium]|nr:FRG domain-containing protein [Bacteroidales bacterium]